MTRGKTRTAGRPVRNLGKTRTGEDPYDRASAAERVDDRVHVVAELADDLGLCAVVEVADEVGRECGLVENVLEGGTVDGDAHAPSTQR